MHINLDKRVLEILNQKHGYQLSWKHFMEAYRERKTERDDARRRAGLESVHTCTSEALEEVPYAP